MSSENDTQKETENDILQTDIDIESDTEIDRL